MSAIYTQCFFGWLLTKQVITTGFKVQVFIINILGYLLKTDYIRKLLLAITTLKWCEY